MMPVLTGARSMRTVGVLSFDKRTLEEVGGVMTETRTVAGTEVPVPGKWELDHDHTVLSFVARHMIFTKVRGRFIDFSGAIYIEEDLAQSRVELEIDAASLATGVNDRDNHLRSADFLNVEEFPTITFQSTAVDLGASTLTGDLTIRGTSHPVTLPYTYEGMAPYPWGGARAMWRANTEIERENWNVSWNVALETGGWLVSKAVELEIEAQAYLVSGGEEE
jgi:polyisoprenoid-binding protein YceI